MTTQPPNTNNEHHAAVKTIRALLPGAEVIDQWLPTDELFPAAANAETAATHSTNPV